MALSFGVGSIVSTVDSDLWLSGSYPIDGLADARAAHATARAELQRGIDPMAERKAEKSAELESKRRASTDDNTDAENPFREVALLWFKKWKEGKACGLRNGKRVKLSDTRGTQRAASRKTF